MSDERKLWTWAGYALGAVLAVLLVVLAVIATDHHWKADAWAALGTWATALVALVAGTVALGQLGEARQLRREQAQPYVVAFMETSDTVDPRFVYLTLRNFGTTAASDVELRIDPGPQRSNPQGGFEAQVWLPERIPVLVPGQYWRTLWDISYRRANTDLPDRHEATVCFKDSQGEAFEFRYVLDWGAHKNRMHVTTYSTHHAAKALREISATVKRWQESANGGLAVFVRNGDAKDERELEDIGAREAQAEDSSEESG